MKRKNWPVVRQRKRVHRDRIRKDWMIDLGMIDGQRKIEYRTTQEEANARAQEIRDEHDRVGAMAFAMPQEQRQDAVGAFQTLPQGVKLTDAVSFYLKHNTVKQQTIKGLHGELLEIATIKHRRPATIAELRTKISGFITKFADIQVSLLRKEDIIEWLRDQHFTSPVAEVHAIRVLHTLFNCAVNHDYITKNPVSGIVKPAIPERDIVFLPVADVTRLLQKAEEKYPLIVPALAIGLFAGVRPNELEQLTWANISFENRYINIDKKIAKIKRTRNVYIEDNLLAWLKKYFSFNKLGYGRRMFYKHLIDLRKEAQVSVWGPDILRHTFATYHLARGQDAGKTAFELGHIRGVEMLYEHYRGANATKSDADKYWQIVPTKGGSLGQKIV